MLISYSLVKILSIKGTKIKLKNTVKY
jgi:hypothetical protein